MRGSRPHLSPFGPKTRLARPERAGERRTVSDEALSPDSAATRAAKAGSALDVSRLRRYTLLMNQKRVITSRIQRPGETVGHVEEPETTMAERIEQVWVLTVECLKWQGERELRLQRTHSRIQRP